MYGYTDRYKENQNIIDSISCVTFDNLLDFLAKINSLDDIRACIFICDLQIHKEQQK